jgi:hypothetical protein
MHARDRAGLERLRERLVDAARPLERLREPFLDRSPPRAVGRVDVACERQRRRQARDAPLDLLLALAAAEDAAVGLEELGPRQVEERHVLQPREAPLEVVDRPVAVAAHRRERSAQALDRSEILRFPRTARREDLPRPRDLVLRDVEVALVEVGRRERLEREEQVPILGSQRLLVHAERALPEREGLRVLAEVPAHLGEERHRPGHVQVRVPELRPARFERLLEVGRRGRPVAAVQEQGTEVVVLHGDQRMPGPQPLLVDRERALVIRLRPGPVAGGFPHDRLARPAEGDVEVIRVEGLLLDLSRAHEAALRRLDVPVLLEVEVAEVGQHLRDLGVVGAEERLLLAERTLEARAGGRVVAEQEFEDREVEAALGGGEGGLARELDGDRDRPLAVRARLRIGLLAVQPHRAAEEPFELGGVQACPRGDERARLDLGGRVASVVDQRADLRRGRRVRRRGRAPGKPRLEDEPDQRFEEGHEAIERAPAPPPAPDRGRWGALERQFRLFSPGAPGRALGYWQKSTCRAFVIPRLEDAWESRKITW